MSESNTNKPFVIFEKFKTLIYTTALYVYYVFYGGRGGGKSENIAACLIIRMACSSFPLRVLCVREIQSSISESVKSLIEGKIEQMGLMHLFTFTRDEIRCINGGVFMFKGLRTSNAANLKSIYNIHVTWCEESEVLSKESLELLLPSVLRTPKSIIIFSFNPRYQDDPVYDMFLAKKPPKNAFIMKVGFEDNPFFKTSGLEAQRLHDLEVKPLSEYKHKWEGEIRKLSENSLFNEKAVEKARYPDHPPREEFYRIVIAVDPATTHKDYSNEYGIVVVGAHESGTLWMLENKTALHTPHSFACEVAELYNKWEAESVVVETNQGGDFIKATLLSQDSSLNVLEVRASRDKIYRAAPVAQLLSLGNIKLLDTPSSGAKTLMDQMSKVTTQGYIGPRGSSPDALDAFVWGIYELAGITEKDTEGTLFKLSYFDFQSGFDFRPPQSSLFICCDARYACCIEYERVESATIERRIVAKSCFIIETQDLIKAEMPNGKSVGDYAEVYLPEREVFYNLTWENLIFYEDKLEEDLDHLALQTLEKIKQNALMFDPDFEKHNFKDARGNLLAVGLLRFKLSEKTQSSSNPNSSNRDIFADLTTKTLCFLIQNL